MKALYILLLLATTFKLSAQNFTGQWKGGFTDNSTGLLGLQNDKIDYVLELDVQGTDATGYSYTYFMEAGTRFYTICKLKGTVDRAAKEITVTEFERTKFNTPPQFRNCFQTHKLKYTKTDDGETLEGNWYPAPNQEGGCGYGHTSLNRRLIKKIIFPETRPETKITPPEEQKNQPFKDLNKEPKNSIVNRNTSKTNTKSAIKKPVTKNSNATQSVSSSTKPLVKNNAPIIKNSILKKDTVLAADIPVVKLPSSKDEVSGTVSPNKFEKRSNTILKTIEVEQPTFTVDLYDNGEIDGDSVSVFYNGKLLVSHRRLSDKPITLTLKLDPSKPINELVMYAENLGEIPPNTALMVITDGDNRYEARITSDTEKNGTVLFKHKQ